jgi:hypothetical protein
MNYFLVATDFTGHRKTRQLCYRLGLQGFYSLICLWSYATRYAASGRLEAMGPADIAQAADWRGEPMKLIDALLEVRFLEWEGDTYRLHDWNEHNRWVMDRDQRSARARGAAMTRWSKIRCPPPIEKTPGPESPVRAVPPAALEPVQADRLAPDSPKQIRSCRRRPQATPEEAEKIGLRTEIWKRYSDAYFARYRTEPVRNAKVNSQVKQLAERLGQDAPFVAEFYVQHHDAFYQRTGHALGALLQNAEGLRTQWATGRRITLTQARLTEQSEAQADSWNRALEILDAMDRNAARAAGETPP